ncbi:saccharopine dehydrogenase family protein [Kordiimonas aquimaris]|uniref:saccharopine dehydrogenase family protein n=1 Tax=Kordiimonas aquimaris TaxID=707591 RepID=UPI0021CE4F40|nr:saccharopine dehydrogenase NADP-binding domain-containing protein [Kordiimonas aquimaris]
MSDSREFDIIVYGATGFTGRLVAEYLALQYGVGKSVKWAMAGRSAEKLSAVRNEIGAPDDTSFVVADASDPASIRAMANRTKVVLTTVGPYQLYGSDLVAACVEAGTDYVDLCGEPPWMRQMIDKYEAAAKNSGARIVFSCGFDSIPFDLGVQYLQDAAKGKFGHVMPRVRGRVRKMKGTFSGGTAASLQATMAAAAKDPSILQLLRDPFSLAPGYEGPEQPRGTKPLFDDVIDSWVAPFIMAPINTRNIHRSNLLSGNEYGKDFIYDEMLVTGPGDKGEAAARAVAESSAMTSDDGPKPGEGPSKEERETGFYDVLFVATNEQGERIEAVVTGDKDPGYGSTSKMIAESAICLVQDDIPMTGGIWTPASIMGRPLTKRLISNAGLTFEIL